MLKDIFAIRIIKALDIFPILNIYKTLFLRNKKSSYSCLKKGKEWNINNICFTKSESLITAINSDESIFAAAAKGNVYGELFKEFF